VILVADGGSWKCNREMYSSGCLSQQLLNAYHVDELADQIAGRRVADVRRVDAGDVAVLSEQSGLELFIVGTCVVVRIGISHDESRCARCTPLGVNEKRRFSFAHQSASRSGDADKLGNARSELTNAVLKFFDGVIGSELVDTSPFEVRTIPLVSRWISVVTGDDSQINEPAQILSSGLRITVNLLRDAPLCRRLTSLEDSSVDALFDIVATERLLKGWRVIGAFCPGHTQVCRAVDMVLTSRNRFRYFEGVRVTPSGLL